MNLVCLILFFAGLCHSVSEATDCTSRGRFPNNDADDCRGYTMCLLGGAAGFTQYKLNCPANFIFSHSELQCTNATNYQCLPSYHCNMSGSFENTSSKNCSSYITCPEGISGIVTARRVECPTGEVFNTNTSACVDSASYICPATMSTSGIPITTEIPVTTPLIVHQNSSYNVTMSGDGFQLAGSVSMNSANGVSYMFAVWFALVVFCELN